MKKLLSYFLQGLLLIAPVAITGYIVYALVAWVDSLVPVDAPGLGFLIVLVVITLVGFLSSTLIFRPVFHMLERLISRTPLVKIVYSAFRDLFGAFVGDKKKFQHPVLVQLLPSEHLYRLGFVTQEDLKRIGLDKYVAVYLPHSYQISGNLVFVPSDNVKVLDDMPSTETMKFIISGGMTGLPETSKSKPGKKQKNEG